jgi:hypothetical protein
MISVESNQITEIRRTLSTERKATRMPASSLKLPYARPTTLSDPCHDFTPEHCAELIAKPDDQLTWHDFQCIKPPISQNETTGRMWYNQGVGIARLNDS